MIEIPLSGTQRVKCKFYFYISWDKFSWASIMVMEISVLKYSYDIYKFLCL